MIIKYAHLIFVDAKFFIEILLSHSFLGFLAFLLLEVSYYIFEIYVVVYAINCDRL